MSSFDPATLQAFKTVRRLEGVSVDYTRTGVGTVSMDVVVGETTAEVVDESGTMTRAKVRDFLVLAQDLVDGGFGDPERGDTIARTIGGTTYTYTVAGPGAEDQSRWWDHSGQVHRIHTIETGVA